MFTVSKDVSLSADLIKMAIEVNEDERERFERLDRYYIGNHDILERTKPKTAKNNKVVVNHASYIVDLNTGYLVGNPVDYKIDDKFDAEEVLEQYREQVISNTDNEIVKKLGIFGRQYELVYNVGNDTRSAIVDDRNCICVYDDTVEHNKLFAILYQLGERKGEYKSIKVYDNKFFYDCVVEGKTIAIGEGIPHLFGKVPVIEFKNNSEMTGDFEQVISLIDAYNTLQSDRINDIEQLVESILVGYGVQLEEKQMRELIEQRTLFGLPIDSKLDYLMRQLDEGQLDILRKTIENDIFKIAKVPNMSDENFAGNSSGVALSYKLLPFEMNTTTKERFVEDGLKERFELYNNYYVALGKMEKIPLSKIDVTFKRSLPQNLVELSQIIVNLQGLVDDETLVGLLPFVDDAGAVVEKNREEERERLGIGNFGTAKENTGEENEKVGLEEEAGIE